MIKPINPHKIGSFAHQQASTYYGWHGDKKLIDLAKKSMLLRIEGKDFCRYSWKAMADFGFQADCIDQIIEANTKKMTKKEIALTALALRKNNRPTKGESKSLIQHLRKVANS